MVIAIIGVLAVAGISIINPLAQIQKTKDSRRKFDLEQVKNALEIYRSENNHFPVGIDGKITDGNGEAIDWGGTGFAPYMGNLPKDPSYPAKTYAYYSDGKQTYYLFASLDRGADDPQSCSAPLFKDIKGNYCPSANNPYICGAGTYPCDYGVSSSDVSVSQPASGSMKRAREEVYRKSPCPPYGDLDGDELVSFEDIGMLGASLTEEQKQNADVDSPYGDPNINDFLALARFLTVPSQSDSFDVCSR